MTREAERISEQKKEILALQLQIEDKIAEMDGSEICQYCNGEGQVVGHISGNEIDVPYKSCPLCKGSGVL